MDTVINEVVAMALREAKEAGEKSISLGIMPSYSDGVERFKATAWSHRDEIIAALSTRASSDLIERYEAALERLRVLVRQYVDPYDVAPQDHALVLAIGTDDNAWIEFAIEALRTSTQALRDSPLLSAFRTTESGPGGVG